MPRIIEANRGLMLLDMIDAALLALVARHMMTSNTVDLNGEPEPLSRTSKHRLRGRSRAATDRDRRQNAFNPRLSTSYSINDRVFLYAAGYRSFRAPTLNQFYRCLLVGK
jgi:outer membrane receptor protein involved in Fe transport